MSVNLVKGQKIGLTGDAGLKHVLVGLGWDAAEQTGGFLKNLFLGKPAPIDYDCSCILLGADGKVISDNLTETAVYFNNLTDASGAIVHRGDNMTGEGDGDDEQITVDLARVPENVDRLVFAVNIYRHDGHDNGRDLPPGGRLEVQRHRPGPAPGQPPGQHSEPVQVTGKPLTRQDGTA